MIELPEGVPEWLADAIHAVEEKRRALILDATKDSQLCRGYFMAVEDLLNEVDNQSRLDTAAREEAHKKAGKRFLEEHGEPA